MNKKTKKESLPDFSKMTLDQVAHYWDTHDAGEHWDEMEEVKDMTFKRAADRSVSVRLSSRDLRDIKTMAGRKGLCHTTLIRSWVLEKLHPRHAHA